MNNPRLVAALLLACILAAVLLPLSGAGIGGPELIVWLLIIAAAIVLGLRLRKLRRASI